LLEVEEDRTMLTINTNTQAVTDKMDKKSTGFLTGYLLVATMLTSYLVYSLWSAQLRASAGQPAVPKSTPAAARVLSALYPDRVSVGSTLSDFLIIGSGFTVNTQVKFNGTQHAALLVDANHIHAGLTSADVAAPATVVVTLSEDGTEFGSAVLTIVPTEVDWHLFLLGTKKINLEVQLLLLVLFTGAFGSCVYALKSLADYQGEDKLYASWFAYYLIQPFEGAGIAFLFYLLIRGGFLAGASADVKTVNQFVVCAIAGLAGAFSDTALIKLREVFQSLFRPTDDRGGKLTLESTTPNLPDGSVGTPYKHTFQASSGTPPFNWSVTPELPAGLSLDASTGTISGVPTAVSPKSSYKFTVKDSATPPESSTVDLTLEIKPAAAGLKVSTTTALPDGSANQPYSAKLQAAGGTAPLKWTVTPALPAGLGLDASTGTISGAPTAVSPKSSYKFTVKDSATPPESSTVDLTLEIKPSAAGLKVSTTALPDGSANQPYSAKLQAAGGTAPLKWTVTPALPAGLGLDASTGTISGAPTAVSPESSYKFTVKDSATPPESSTVELTLEIK
jgi:hypothetical protein